MKRTMLRLVSLIPALIAFGALNAPAATRYENYSFVTLAGNHGDGINDGQGPQARFTLPLSVARDAAGNLFVADAFNNTIRKVTPTGLVTTFAGQPGSRGDRDGTGGDARFLTPYGVTVDAAGFVYVTDSRNSTIRKITPDGVVTTLAGSAGQRGSIDGSGSQARFGFPVGISVDGGGNVYVADQDNFTIRKITPQGVVTTLAGRAKMGGSADGQGSEARFYFPAGVEVDEMGNLYVADAANDTIRKVTSDGVVTTVAGVPRQIGHQDGDAASATFYDPQDVAVDAAHNIYVADSNNQLIRKISPQGVVTTLAGSPFISGSEDGNGSAARFDSPNGLVATDAGVVYVTDSYNNTIREISPAADVSTLAGLAGGLGSVDGVGRAARFNEPNALAIERAGTVYVADTFNHTVRKITPDGTTTTFAGVAGQPGSQDGTGGAAQFNTPLGIAFDRSSGALFIADTVNDTIRKITPDGTVTTFAGLAGMKGSDDGQGSAARFFEPAGLAIDGSGNIFVADFGNDTIRKITASGLVSTVAGSPRKAGNIDGVGRQARFDGPEAVAVDRAGAVYVADTHNDSIRKITPDATVTTIANRTNDGLNGPEGVAAGNDGTVFVADTGNSLIRKIHRNGFVTILGGVADPSAFGGNAEGVGRVARFSLPGGVAVDRHGVLYVADSVNDEIKIAQPAP